MKILNLSHSFPSNRTDSTTPFVHRFISAFSAMPGITAELLIPAQNSVNREDFKIHQFQIRAGNRIPHKGIGSDHRSVSKLHQLEFLWQGIAATRKLLKRDAFDLVHAHWAIPCGLIAQLASVGLKTRVVVTTHGRDVINAPEVGYDVAGDIILGKAVRLVLKGADLVITTSPTTEEFVNQLAPGAHTTMIPVGIEDNWLSSFEEAPIGNSLLFVGDLIPLKGLQVLLDAVEDSPILRALELVVVGDGSLRSHFEDFCRKHELKNVVFRGAISRSELRNTFRSARLLVMPSLVEGFGIVTLEALSAGLAVVASDTGGVPLLQARPVLRRWVKSVPPNDTLALQQAIEEMWDGGPVRNLREVQQEIREHFEWKVIAAEHVKMYRRLIE